MDMQRLKTRRRYPSLDPSSPADAETFSPSGSGGFWLAALLLLLGSHGVEAQYSAPGTAAPSRGIPEEEIIQESLDSARWNVGAWKFGPWLGVQDASFVQFDDSAREARDLPKNDYTVTVGAGLRGYLRTGKLIFATHALPEYVWWEEDEDRRQINGRYGAGLFGYLNRLTLELSLRRKETQGFFSPEIQELTSNREDILRAAIEVDLGSRISIFALGTATEFTNEDDVDSRFAALDRDEETLLLGVRYHTSKGLTVSLSFEDVTYDFASLERDLSSAGDISRLEVELDGNRIDYRVALASYSLDPEPGSLFRGFDDTTGLLEVSTALSRSAGLFVYGRRSLAFSTRQETSHYLTERYGARLDFGRQRFSFSLFAETGEDDYEAALGEAFERADDVQAFGAGLAVDLTRLISLRVNATITDYDSNFDFFDRDITSIGFSVELGALFEKLQVGERPGVW